MSPFSRQTQDRRVTTVGGGLNERFSRLEKPAPTPKPAIKVETRTSTSVFSRIHGKGVSTPPRRSSSDIQSRIGRVAGGSIQKRVGKAQPMTTKKPKSTGGALRVKQTTKKTMTTVVTKQQKGTRKADPKSKKKTVKSDKKKPVSADDLDKALDSYMMKDPKTAEARLNDELDSYMDEAGDVLMEL